jgi:hypothetical protein
MVSTGAVEIVPGRTDEGEHVFSVIVKRTYRVMPSGLVGRADADGELRKIDEYYDHGDPEWSTVRHESELAPFKPATDVVVIGKAYAAQGKPTVQMMVAVRVGTRRKVLQVTGDRRCHYRPTATPVFSDPDPFQEMELRYERAYGGGDEKSIPTIPFLYPRNFRGTGVVLRNLKEVVEGLALPNIEDPQDPISPERLFIEHPDRWHLQPLPQGFGWYHREWYPRSALLGSYPPFIDPGTVTAEERMGLVPQDHVALAKQSRLRPLPTRFANGASLGMVFADLRGDETVSLDGLTPDGHLEFSLPGDTPTIRLDLGSGAQELSPHLHTVSIRPDDREVDLVWRGARPYEGYAWLPKLTRLEAEVH